MAVKLTKAQLRDLRELVAHERAHPGWSLFAPRRTTRGLVLAGCLRVPDTHREPMGLIPWTNDQRPPASLRS